MTEDQWDEVYVAKILIERGVDIVVNKHTAALTPEQDAACRTLLTENFRFWSIP